MFFLKVQFDVSTIVARFLLKNSSIKPPGANNLAKSSGTTSALALRLRGYRPAMARLQKSPTLEFMLAPIEALTMLVV